MEQIRVLLIDSFVMTTLFYPALALQFKRSSSKKGRHPRSTLLESARDESFSLLATPWLDNFFPYSQPPIQLSTPDFFWEQSHTASDASLSEWVYEDVADDYRDEGTNVQLVAAPIAWITVDQVLAPKVGSTSAAGGRYQPESQGSGDNQIADRVSKVVDILRSTEGIVSVDCLEVSPYQSGCLANSSLVQSSAVVYLKIVRRDMSVQVSEPLGVAWQNANEAISSDDHGVLLDSTKFGQPDPASRRVAIHVCRSNDSSESSLLILQGNQARPTKLATVSDIRASQRAEEIPTAIIVLYTMLLAYLLVLLSRATNVHSRFGLAFTGVVELACSSIMSFSVMALLGFSDRRDGNRNGEANVPYYILPFVILIVGVENMSAIVKAVYGVPVSFSVPDRVGLGLAKVGPSMLFTSLSDIGILAVIGGVIKLRPVRDFCIFASILIVVHFWMLITFFLTVLSIDCQRLELDDLLRQISEFPKKSGHEIEQKDHVHEHGEPMSKRSRGRSGSATTEHINSTWIMQARKAWKARTARGGSLIMLLTLLTGLYYANESRDVRAGLDHLRYSSLDTLQGDNLPAASASQMGPWQFLTASHGGRAVFRILPITRVLLPCSAQAVAPHELIASLPSVTRPRLPRFDPVFRLVKIVILPQCLTAFAVWLILLYLLKDADLLDAQRNKKYAGEPTDTVNAVESELPDDAEPISGARLASRVSSRTALSAEADVVHVAAAATCNIALAITAMGQAMIFRPLEDKTLQDIAHPSLAPRDIRNGALSDDGQFVCLVDGSANLVFLDISSPDAPSPVGRASFELPSGVQVVDVVIHETGSIKAIEELPNLQACAIFSDGSVWTANSNARGNRGVRVIDPAEMIVFSRFLRPAEMANALIVSSSTEAVVWQAETKSGGDDWKRVFAYKSAFSSANITSATVFRACDAEYVALGNSKGFLSIYAIGTSACVWTGPLSPSCGSTPVYHLTSKLMPSACCPQCSVRRSTTLCIIGSSLHTLSTLRFDVRNEAHDDCTCPSPPRQSSTGKPLDQLLSVPIKRPTPRRGSRTFAGSANPIGRVSPSSSPVNSGARGDARLAEPPDQSSYTSYAVGVAFDERRDSPGHVDDDLSVIWTNVDATERPMHRGAFAMLGGQEIMMLVRKQTAIAGKRMDGQWQLVITDSLSAGPADDLELPLHVTPSTPGRLKREREDRSLNNHRAQRLAQLDKRQDDADGNGDETLHQLLAFSRVQSCNFELEDFCVFVTGNWVRSYSIRGSIQLAQTSDRVARRSTAFHTAPLATPTFVTSRR